MKSSTAWTQTILPLILLSLLAAPAIAQFTVPVGQGYDSQYAAQGPYFNPGASRQWASVPTPAPAYPAQPNEAFVTTEANGGAPETIEEEVCSFCNGQGCKKCGRRGGWFDGPGSWGNRIFGSHRTYRGDTIADPRWYNINVEGLFLERDDVSRTINFTQQGGDIVLSSNSLDFDEEAGFRFTFQMQLGNWSSLEASYFGTFTWASAAAVNGAGDLFSVFSNFGTNPGGGFAETDAASFHSINYSSTIHNIELSWRHRFMSPNGRVHSSIMTGVRYMSINEVFLHTSISGPDWLLYQNDTSNDLVGWQSGFDLSLALTPRMSISGECKIGLYGNNATQHTRINTSQSAGNELPDNANETAHSGNAAWIGETGVKLVYRISPCISFTAGYQYIFVDGVALAIENFDPNPAFGTRTQFINDNGSIQLHGATASIDWRW